MLEKLKGKERLIRDWEQINFYKELRVDHNATNKELNTMKKGENHGRR